MLFWISSGSSTPKAVAVRPFVALWSRNESTDSVNSLSLSLSLFLSLSHSCPLSLSAIAFAGLLRSLQNSQRAEYNSFLVGIYFYVHVWDPTGDLRLWLGSCFFSGGRQILVLFRRFMRCQVIYIYIFIYIHIYIYVCVCVCTRVCVCSNFIY